MSCTLFSFSFSCSLILMFRASASTVPSSPSGADSCPGSSFSANTGAVTEAAAVAGTEALLVSYMRFFSNCLATSCLDTLFERRSPPRMEMCAFAYPSRDWGCDRDTAPLRGSPRWLVAGRSQAALLSRRGGRSVDTTAAGLLVDWSAYCWLRCSCFATVADTGRPLLGARPPPIVDCSCAGGGAWLKFSSESGEEGSTTRL